MAKNDDLINCTYNIRALFSPNKVVIVVVVVVVVYSLRKVGDCQKTLRSRFHDNHPTTKATLELSLKLSIHFQI